MLRFFFFWVGLRPTDLGRNLEGRGSRGRGGEEGREGGREVQSRLLQDLGGGGKVFTIVGTYYIWDSRHLLQVPLVSWMVKIAPFQNLNLSPSTNLPSLLLPYHHYM